MYLVLSSFTYLVAEEDMRCDAFGVWNDLSHLFTLEQKSKAIGTNWFEARHGILKGETYLRYEFLEIDQFSGEVIQEYFFNCKIGMNKTMVRNKLYPNTMKLAFKNYKKISSVTQ
jgi:hypothetical protein